MEQSSQINNTNFKDSKYATGRRKKSIAKVWLKKGSGKITVNGKNFYIKDFHIKFCIIFYNHIIFIMFKKVVTIANYFIIAQNIHFDFR